MRSGDALDVSSHGSRGTELAGRRRKLRPAFFLREGTAGRPRPVRRQGLYASSPSSASRAASQEDRSGAAISPPTVSSGV